MPLQFRMILKECLCRNHHLQDKDLLVNLRHRVRPESFEAS
jgi:hypothetical protein